MSRVSILLVVVGILMLLGCASDLNAFVAAADDLSAAIDPDDYYAILELPAREDASERDVKSNWRSLSRKYHPDLHGEKTRVRYQQIQGAYEVLSDRRKRKVYDMKGVEGLKQLEQAKQQGNQPQDPILRMMGFGGGGGSVNRGKNVNLVMLITLEDAYNGASHTVKLSKNKLCRKCRGTGADSKADYQKCPHCDGRGAVMQRIQLAPGFVQQMQQQCGHCSGTGQIVKKKCTSCRGRKVVPAEQMISVDVEQGTAEGTELTFEMEADQSPDQLPGDVVFTVQTAPHAVFSRKGSDLEMEMQLTLAEALLGFERTITHLDEHTFTVAETDPVQSGQKRVIKGEGMPVHHVPSEKGKLTVTYRIKFPQSLTDAQKKVIASTF